MSTTVYSAGIISMSVCTNDSDGDMLAVVNAEYPTGLEHGWQISSEGFHTGEPNGKPCEQEPDKRHVLVIC